MEQNFYVTIFSNSNMDLYPKNSKSKFTCRLPKVLKFDSDYEVGICECTFSPIIGVTDKADVDLDLILIPKEKIEDITSAKLDGMIETILNNAKHPSFYTRAYFREFLNQENYKDFESNPELSKYKVTANSEAEPVLFKVYSYAKEYRGDDETIKHIRFESERAYTCKQLLWIIMNTYYKIYLEAQNDPGIMKRYNITFFGKSMSELLYYAALTFVNRLRSYVSNFQNAYTEESDYLLIYTNIIRERIVSDSLSKVLFISNRPKNTLTEQIEVRNIQYFPLCLQEIDEISIILCDEQASLLILESSSTPTCLTLHFRKMV